MASIKTHKDLDVWKRSISFVNDVYKATTKFPKEEKYGLTAQLRRCCVSVPANIAEGAGRKSRKEFIQYLYIALGSLSELETQLLISKEVYNLEKHPYFESELESIRRMLIGLIRHLEAKLS